MNYLKLWPVALIALIPIAYIFGSWNGARNKETEMNNAHLIATANNNIKTVSEIAKIKSQYQAIYEEMDKSYEAPSCHAPPVLIDVINRLPDLTAN